MVLDPYIRKFVSAFAHSNHERFIDPRRIGYTAHLWAAFVSDLSAWLTASLRRLYRAPDGQRFRLHRPPEYQGRRFRALPLHSTYRIISSPYSGAPFHLFRLVGEQVARTCHSTPYPNPSSVSRIAANVLPPSWLSRPGTFSNSRY